jgi:exodeoxyribonuclease III
MELKGTEIKIISWNINGIDRILEEKGLETIITKELPDILCLNEVKSKDNTEEKIDQECLKDYKQYFNHCIKRKLYSGVAIFSKLEPIKVTYGLNNPQHDSEGRVITAEFENFFLCSVYVPNSGDELKRLEYRTQEWDTCFREYLNKLTKVKDVVVCGDLNVAHEEIDIFNPKTHLRSAGYTIEERKNFTLLLKESFIDSFRYLKKNTIKYSYFNFKYGKKNFEENKGWRLDYFLLNKGAEGRLKESDISYEYVFSDHMPIILKYLI